NGAVLADLVVLLALLGVTEDVVGRADLLEALLRAGVGIGVVLLRQLAVRLRDLLVARRRDDAEHLVVVLLEPFALCGHGSVHPRTRTMAARSTCPFQRYPERSTSSTTGSPDSPPSPSARATASCTDGSKGTSAWSTRSSPSLERMSMSMAREARSALPSSLTSSDSFRWASARSSVSSTGRSLLIRSAAARAD